MDGASEWNESAATQRVGPLFIAEDVQAACILCRRTFSPVNEAARDLEGISICGDCKFLLVEDASPRRYSQRSRTSTRRRFRHRSSESGENLFSHQITRTVASTRLVHGIASSHEDRPGGGDSAASLLSSRTTPSGSSRWQRVISDTESDGFDNLDSLYGENESNVSFGPSRNLHGESDAVSFSAYGGESDISVDGRGFLDADTFGLPDNGSNFDSDTDIDPMHAGIDQWNSDDQEEGEGETEWEETDVEELETMEGRSDTRYFLTSSPDNRSSRLPAYEDTFSWRFREGRRAYISNGLANTEEADLPPRIRNSGDNLDAAGFEALLEHFAETEISIRGAPPASVSFVKNLPIVVVNEDNEKCDDLTCAVCKEYLSVGTEVNQLPCFHLYHSACILPWLRTRNSCPLCRHELPTDDKEYEEGKLNSNNGPVIHEIQHQNFDEDSYASDDSVVVVASGQHHGGTEHEMRPNVISILDSSRRDGERRNWVFLATAPVLGIVGIALVLWLGSPLIGRRVPLAPGSSGLFERGQHLSSPVNSLISSRENRRRYWYNELLCG